MLQQDGDINGADSTSTSGSDVKSSDQRTPYGRKIPALTFSDSLQIITRLSETGGEENSLDALAGVVKNSLKSSTFQAKLAALRSFGLLSADKTTYKFTATAISIVRPTSPDEKKQAILQAFSAHDVLGRVWDAFKGKVLPQKDYLANYLEKNINVPTALKIEWAEYFIEAAKTAEVLSERGQPGSFTVLSGTMPTVQEQKHEEKRERHREAPAEQPPPQPRKTVENLFDDLTGGLLYRKKISGDRRILIFVPEELTQGDVDAIRSILKSVDAGLEGLKSTD